MLNEIDTAVIFKRVEVLLGATRALELHLNNQLLGQIMFAIGIAMYPQHGSTQQELVKAADQALYVAEESGRNQLKVAEGDVLTPPKTIFSKKAA